MGGATFRLMPIQGLTFSFFILFKYFFPFSGVLSCAEAVSKKGYTIFGLQYYGECWSGENVVQTYAKYGKSSQCLSAVNKKFKPCNDDSDEACVGASRTNYIYKITPSGK